MRVSEWINLGYLLLLVGLGAVWPLPAAARARIFALGLAGALLTLAARQAPGWFGEDLGVMVRNWMPATWVLIAYWQAGQFYRTPSLPLMRWLEAGDRRFGRMFSPLARLAASAPASIYLELSYLAAYPLVPLAFGVLYFQGFAARSDQFWSVVLLSSYSCYAMLLVAPTAPPRLAHPASAPPGRRGGPGRMNLWVLDRLGVGANTFPSGHVASTTAASLMVWTFLPAVGALFLAVAGGIAVSVAVRRYHYALDAVLGAAVAVVFWVLVMKLL